MESRTTIYALASGPARAAIAVVRISGPLAEACFEAFGTACPEPRVATIRTLRDGAGAIIDRGLALWFPAPASFTGEAVAELQIHGSPAVVSAVLEVLGGIEGFAPAEPGAFARRAFENSRLDLTEVEGLADLIDAETQAQRRQAARQMAGGLRHLYEGWAQTLVRAMADLEATIDFADEGDVDDRLPADLVTRLKALRDEVGDHLGAARSGERLRDGLSVVIAGAPNAGKSSLINALAGRDVAIVTEHAGTTRDLIEVHLDLSGLPVTLVDTAGLRAGAAGVEIEGIRRAERRIAQAEIVIWLVDGTADAIAPVDAVTPGPGGETLVCINKCDLFGGDPPAVVGTLGREGTLMISAKTGAGLEQLLERLREMARVRMAGSDGPAPTRHRHRVLLEQCVRHITRGLDAGSGETELLAEDLRLAARALGRLTGRIDVEDILDVIFAEFCIGK